MHCNLPNQEILFAIFNQSQTVFLQTLLTDILHNFISCSGLTNLFCFNIKYSRFLEYQNSYTNKLPFPEFNSLQLLTSPKYLLHNITLCRQPTSQSIVPSPSDAQAGTSLQKRANSKGPRNPWETPYSTRSVGRFTDPVEVYWYLSAR